MGYFKWGYIMIYLVGMGPGNVENLTLEAVEVLKSASKIISFGRIGNTAEYFNKNIIKVKSLDDIGKLLEQEVKLQKNIVINELDDKIQSNIDISNTYENNSIIAILASGDPCFYGILEYLKRKEINIYKVIPGVSSLQYMMSKLKKSWHNSNLISFHGREDEKEEKIEKIRMNRLSIILTDSKNTPNSISKLLYEKGIRGKLYAGFNLSYEDELIVTTDIGNEINNESSLALVVIDIEER